MKRRSSFEAFGPFPVQTDSEGLKTRAARHDRRQIKGALDG